MKDLLAGRRFRLILIGVGLLGLLLCCGCVLLAFAIPPASPGTSGRIDVLVCVGVVVQPRFQVGLWWQWLAMSRLLPGMTSPYAACANLPWPSFLPPAGELAFPP